MKSLSNILFGKAAVLFFLLFTYNFAATPNDKATEYLAFAEKMPEMVGGLGALNKYIVYPDLAVQAGISGKVFVVIFVNENGGVDDVKVLKGIGMGCDEEAVRVVKKMQYTPGEHKGAKVKVKLAIAIDFKLH